ncbi:ABC transporter permease [Paenibacillus sp. J2TS4]|uniref:ABC transporter permease n=1 Tax=Paenibacillus sp. J2TS4 TaxID=2807194 RepID=UPI001B03A2AD|nr:ABC transporter permease [Paenibacillus sp. J2TS4]GIP36320.1 ABC transporter permease [Paenibacillus sp. J2TS4]
MINPVQLWGSRRRAFWKEAAYYWSYVGRSLSQGFLFFALIGGMYVYIQWLETLPENFAYYWLVVPLITWPIAHSPIRTFLQQADRVFLLPAESRIGTYFNRALRYSFLWQAAAAILMTLVLWPLYKIAKPEAPIFLLLVGFLLLVKWGNLLGSWQEGKVVHKRSRWIVRWVRWIASASVVYTLYEQGVPAAGLLSLVWIVILWIAYRKMSQYPVPWEYLIQKEQAHKSMHYLFFSWFIEVEHLPNRVKPRRWLTAVTSRFPFHPKSTYLYLFTKTYIRSETASIAIRLTLIGALLLILLPNPIWKTAAFAVFVWMSCVQMSSLDQYHRYTFWLKLYPISPGDKKSAIIRISFASLLGQTLLLSAVLLWQCEAVGYSWAMVAIMLMFISMYCFIGMRKKLKRTSLQL